MNKINYYKEVLGLNTSEELFEITNEPKYQCPNIDYIQDSIKKGIKSIDSYLHDLRNIEGASGIASDIDSELSNFDLLNEIKAIRTDIIKLRDWGEGWKRLAKYILESQDNKFIFDSLSVSMQERCNNITK